MALAAKRRDPPPDWLRAQAAPHGLHPDARKLAEEHLPVGYAEMRGTQMVMTIAAALAAVIAAVEIVPDLDFVELCSGCGECCYWVRQAGLSAHEYDAATRCADENLAMPLGLFWAGILILRTRAHGLVLMSPECSSWGWINTAVSQRHLSVFGNDARLDVRMANWTAEALAMLIGLCTQRGVHFLVEQPRDSRWARHPSAALALQMADANRLTMWMGSFGHAMPKPTVLHTTLPEQHRAKLCRPKPPKAAKDATFYARRGRWVTGGPRLASSERYPTAFCTTVAGIVHALMELRGLPQPEWF